MKELEILKKDFLGLINGVQNNIPKDVLIKQADGAVKNYIDYVKNNLSSDSHTL